MKKAFLTACAVALTTAVFTSCSNDDSVLDGSAVKSKSVTFALEGDWQGSEEAYKTRAAVTGSTMTDVWVLDYMGSTLMQTVHQSSADADFGAPTVSLDYGEHTLYFVTSCGDTPTLNTTTLTLSFDKVKDTFWKSVNVNVTSGTAANQSVTLDRIVTKLIIKPTDQVPMNISTVDIQLSTWYNSIDYLTGQPATASTDLLRSVAVTDNYHGTTGTIYFIVQGFCGTTDFTTNVSVTAKDADSNTIGFAQITNAPMKRNRTSRFTGTLFGNSNGLAMNMNDEWLTDYEGAW
jgi:hypothetical protein